MRIFQTKLSLSMKDSGPNRISFTYADRRALRVKCAANAGMVLVAWPHLPIERSGTEQAARNSGRISIPPCRRLSTNTDMEFPDIDRLRALPPLHAP
jgi:hypothetical protein